MGVTHAGSPSTMPACRRYGVSALIAPNGYASSKATGSLPPAIDVEATVVPVVGPVEPSTSSTTERAVPDSSCGSLYVSVPRMTPVSGAGVGVTDGDAVGAAVGEA